MAIVGNNILILRGQKAIAGTKAHEIQCGADTIEIASATQQDWEEHISGRKNWSLNVNYLVLAAAGTSDSSAESFGLGDLLTVGNSYTIVIKDRSNTKSISGTAILTNCKQTYNVGNLVAGTFQFKGTGALS